MLDKSIHSFLQALFLHLSLGEMQPRVILVLVLVLVQVLATVLVKVAGYRVALQVQMITRRMIRLAVVKLHLPTRLQRQNPGIRNLKQS